VRRPLIAGNWKMNLTCGEATALAEEVAQGEGRVPEAELMVCPPSVYLMAVAQALAGSRVQVGAQNVYHEPRGAFTGEISAGMLKDVGCSAAILGHSERRHILGETDEDVNRKLHAVLEGELTPIVCVGELLQEREAGRTDEVIRRQFDRSLAGLSIEAARRTVIAYEPVWAIGTGKVATPEQAEQVHAALRKLLADRYNDGVSQQVRVLYGGSVKPENAADLLAQPNVDGALVGGASLKGESFLAIAEAAPKDK